MQFAEHARWMPALGIGYHLAVDGISVLFVGLTAFLTVLVMIYSWDTVRNQVRLYFMALLALETTTIGIFVSDRPDPVLRLLGAHAHPQLFPDQAVGRRSRNAIMRRSSLCCIRCWAACSCWSASRCSISTIINGPSRHHLDRSIHSTCLNCSRAPIPLHQQILIFWMMFMGFAFKAPVFPFHTWLPDALVEGPIGMAVMLAGIETGYLWIPCASAFRCFRTPRRAKASCQSSMVLGLAAILYGAIVALIQPDFRRLLAFSSISHLGFVVVGLFALNYQGLQGSLLTMINLGFSTAGLFFIAGFLIDQATEPQLSAFGGLAKQVPLLATFLSVHRTGVHRIARHERLCRRISDSLGRFQSQVVVWRGRGARRHLRRGLFSLVLRTVDAGAPRRRTSQPQSTISICAKSRSPYRSRS